MSAPQIVLVIPQCSARTAQARVRAFLELMERYSRIWRVMRHTQGVREDIPVEEPQVLRDTVPSWLGPTNDVTVFLSHIWQCPDDPELARFGGMSTIVWKPSTKKLRLTISLETASLFMTPDVGMPLSLARSQWLRTLADALWDGVHPERLVADIDVLELPPPGPSVPPGLPWLVYARSIDVLERIIPSTLRATGRIQSKAELRDLLKRYAYDVYCNGTGRLKVCFTETIDGYVAGRLVRPAPQAEFLKAYQS